MKIITIAQPWAAAAVLGELPALSMPRPTAYRGPLAIVAGWRDRRTRRIRPIDLPGSALAAIEGEVLGVVVVRGCVAADGSDLPWAWGPHLWTIYSPWVCREGLRWPYTRLLADLREDQVQHITQGMAKAGQWKARRSRERTMDHMATLSHEEIFGQNGRD